jgi:hypothetical protein
MLSPDMLLPWFPVSVDNRDLGDRFGIMFGGFQQFGALFGGF